MTIMSKLLVCECLCDLGVEIGACSVVSLSLGGALKPLFRFAKKSADISLSRVGIMFRQIDNVINFLKQSSYKDKKLLLFPKRSRECTFCDNIVRI